MAFDAWLEEATSADLEALARGLREGRIPLSTPDAAVRLAGFGEGAVQFVRHFSTTDPNVTAWVFERLARERREADDRYAETADLVWSGIADDDEAIRDTRVVLDEVFSRAMHRVIVSTYVIYDGLLVFRRLVERVRAVPGLQVDLYVHLGSEAGRPEDEASEVAAFLATFHRLHWPTGVRVPSIYYLPESRRQGNERCSLHAKCVVVDDRWAFVTSANLTAAAQERNIEVGVVLDHPRLAASLAARFSALKDRGLVKRMC